MATIDPAPVEELGLVFAQDDEPGIRRTPSGAKAGFTYVGPDGRRVRDEATLARIAALAVPPAWTDVWICPHPDGHVQATGRDARRRKQYRYHARFRAAREDAKYELLVPFGHALPQVRRAITADLARPGVPRERVLALVVRLLELTAIRVGNDEYAKANRSYGLTTMLDRHARFGADGLCFEFRGKSGKEHSVQVCDRRMAKLVRTCQELPGQRLFQYVDDNGQRLPVTSTDVNAYLRELAGLDDVTAKTFRTWAGTLRVASSLARRERPTSDRDAKRTLTSVITAVAGELGNTPAVCRASYVHPLVTSSFLAGTLPDRWQQGPARASRWLSVSERRLLHLLAEGGVDVALDAVGTDSAAA